ncbi:hypothetical protein KHQ89_04665 [Mycoplasmatota bacterium]|nr:hypothetical protein KHQ89_04665 [Mycoplasmatota bacterium]
MDQLKLLQLKLLELNKIINDHKAMLIDNPEDIETRLSLSSFESLYMNFKDQYMHLSDELNYEVIDYRIMNSIDDSVPISEITESLNLFQTLFSLVFDVTKNNSPKSSTHLSSEIRNSSTLKYGFSYAGSVGFVLTIDNHRDLIDDTLDRTIENTMNLISITNRQELDANIKKFGVATIKTLNNWVTVNEKYDSELEIKTNNKNIPSLKIDTARFEQVNELISHEPLISTELITILKCELVGADTKSATFHIIDKSKSFKGSISDNIDLNFSLPSIVNVKLNEETKEFNGKITKKYLLTFIEIASV